MTKSDGLSWHRLVQQAEGLLSVSSNRISNAANLSALIASVKRMKRDWKQRRRFICRQSFEKSFFRTR